jgi:Sec7-like guanine-nucleotide exchange factor
MAIKKFNESPKKGLKALVDAGLVENSAGDIAKFFLLSDELKKVFTFIK